MRTFLCAAVIAVAALLPATSFAQEGTQLVLLRIPDSEKDTEIHLAKVLLEKLKINSSLQAPKSDPENIIVRAQFKAAEDKGLPAIVMLIDTKIMQRDSDGKPITQVISISSFADIKLQEGKESELLAWANKLNRQRVPMRVYLAGDKIGIGRNLLNSTQFPLAENAVTAAFMRVYRAWISVLADMRKQGYLES